MSDLKPAGANKVRSPCINVCALDDRDICIGCRRTGMEIARWGVMSEDEKREVLSLLDARDLNATSKKRD